MNPVSESILASVRAAVDCAETAARVEIEKRDQRIAELERALNGAVVPADHVFIAAAERLAGLLEMQGRFLVDFGLAQIESEVSELKYRIESLEK